MQKVILKVDWSCEKTKKKAITIVSENKDVQGFAVDEEKKQMTVDGDMDPVLLVKKLRRKFPTTEIVFMETKDSPSRPQAPSPNPQVNYSNPYPGYCPDLYNHNLNYGYGPYPPPYGHPNPQNFYAPSAPPYYYPQ